MSWRLWAVWGDAGPRQLLGLFFFGSGADRRIVVSLDDRIVHRDERVCYRLLAGDIKDPTTVDGRGGGGS